MEKKQFIQLLKKYKQGNATNEERQFVDSYYELFKANPGLDDLLEQEENEQLKLNIKDNIWEKIKQEPEIPTIRKIHFIPVKVAIAALVIITTGLILYNNSIHHSETDKSIGITEAHLHENHITPGSNKATLTLSDGQEIVLDSINPGTLVQQGDIHITKQSNGELVYQANAPVKEQRQEMKYNTLFIPMGGEYKVTLADGTRVWLNAGSSLRYPVEFSANERNVILSGEAYFEVAKQPGRSFIVKAGDTRIKVLGTHFNISAYDDEEVIKTTLSEGAVKVSKGGESRLLKPGEQAISNRLTEDIKIETVEVDKILAWKDGLFHFDNTNIEAIMKEVTRWYDVDVVFATKDLERKHFSGIMSRYGEVDTLLQRLELTGTVHFKIEGRKIIVKD